jgi:probable HAF family extracellular repeat protein
MKLHGMFFSLALLSACAGAQQNNIQRPRYQLIEIGTFGGPNSYYNGGTPVVTNSGLLTGAANTPATDPYAPDCLFDGACFVQHAFLWRNGALTDLGALPGGDYSSYTNGVNSRGLVVGQSQNGNLDPFTGLPDFVATIWNHGKVKSLGTLGGGFSIAISLTSNNFVMGAAENGIADTSGFRGDFFGVSQIRGFGWHGGKIFDLGTLGGTSTFPNAMNDSAEIVGFSATSALPGSFGAPPTAPFLWSGGRMFNLGTLGGSYGTANVVNEKGEVAGASSLATNPFACVFYYSGPDCHAFLWRNGRMHDLGTLGGSYSAAELINDFGQAAGFSGVAGDSTFHAFAWKHDAMIDLGTLGKDNYSRAFGMNDAGWVVGQSWLFDGENTTASHAFVWYGRGQIIDLNTVVSNSTELFLTEANFITDRGWIVANGVLPTGDLRAAILIPKNDPVFKTILRHSTSATASRQPVKPSSEILRRIKEKNRNRNGYELLQHPHGNRLPQ